MKNRRKLAIITGGSRGIGKGIARELADAGYSLLLVAKDSRRLKNTAKEISAKHNAHVDYFVCDIANPSSTDSLYRFCISKRIIPDVLVNNAGIFVAGGTKETQLREYDKIMSVNTRGMFYLTQKLLPLLKKGHNQRIVIISSIWALDSYPAEGREDGTIYSVL